ncbi:hypothetical protein KV097_18660 [Mumia sp. zg.B17]|uniref:hypothetical protein n=1 Tax=Mumia sp. zg.B17 TaxID=2855446 RepID=UPI001C6F3DFE|nr:hypothetical protein [Mumia sp. zg.B17]MBW9207965.1 hypothetical protein [Mumia sp. zg.B17]
MAEESDGIAEAFEGQLRVLITAASQVGERIARLREAAARRAQAQSEQEARELRSRIEVEQRAARAELANVYRPDWWDRADAKQIGHTYQVARAWANDDPEAGRAEQHMRDQLRSRYGVDVNNTQADPAAVSAAVERAQRDLAGASDERNRSSAEIAEAQRLMAEANREERRNEHEAMTDADAGDSERGAAEMKYDSAERRERTARDLEAKGIDGEAVATKMRADVSQAHPATAAVKDAGGPKKSKARETRGRAAQVQRSGLDR